MNDARVYEYVRVALSAVYDPCSVAAGRPVSIVDLGLLVSADLDDEGELTIVLCTTFPGCTMAPHFTRAAEEQAREIPGVRSVRVRVDPEHTWTPSAASTRPLAPAPAQVVPWALRKH
jgi:metal-sulfur cluster biosynthetic enzyme